MRVDGSTAPRQLIARSLTPLSSITCSNDARDATRSLKRILRDVLRDAVAIRERIKTLEELSGLGSSPGPGPSQGQATVTGSITATAGSSWTQVKLKGLGDWSSA